MIDHLERIRGHFNDSAALKQMAAQTMAAPIARAGAILTDCLFADGKILSCGNGGSAADAQHFAAELVGRFERERPELPAIALTTDTSLMTAVANDYSFEQIFARQVRALGAKGDVLLAISTSGRSPSILNALRKARERGLVTVGFTGAKGLAMGELCDELLIAPSDDTPLIQQIHLATAHGICETIEAALMSDQGPQ